MPVSHPALPGRPTILGERPHPPDGQGRGYFPNERAVLKARLHGNHVPRPQWLGPGPMGTRWKNALNAFDITLDGGLSAARRQSPVTSVV